MALTISASFKQSGDGNSILLYDTTGIYDALINTVGYGSPNKDVSDIVSAVANVYPPTFTVPIAINVAAILPNTNKIPAIINNSDLGLSGILVDGIWTIIYVLIDSSANTYSFTAQELFTYNTSCCIKQMGAKVAGENDDDCNCSNKNSKASKFKEAKNFLDLAIISACDGNIVNAQTNLDRASDICDDDCNCS